MNYSRVMRGPVFVGDSRLYKQYVYLVAHFTQLLVSKRARFHARPIIPPFLARPPPNLCSIAQIFTICQLVWIIHSSPPSHSIFVISPISRRGTNRSRWRRAASGSRVSFAKHLLAQPPPVQEWRCRMQNAMSCSLAESTLTQPHGYITRIAAANWSPPTRREREERENPPAWTTLISANTAARGDTAAQTLNRSIHDAQVTWNTPLLTLFDLYALIPVADLHNR